MAGSKKITDKNWFFILFLFLLALFYTVYQGVVESRLAYKQDLQREIKILRARYVEIARQLQLMYLQGQIEAEIKKRGLNLVKTQIPKVLYVEPQKSQSSGK